MNSVFYEIGLNTTLLGRPKRYSGCEFNRTSAIVVTRACLRSTDGVEELFVESSTRKKTIVWGFWGGGVGEEDNRIFFLGGTWVGGHPWGCHLRAQRGGIWYQN